MTECLEMEGKVVQRCSLYQDGPYGPEILIEFTDGTLFSSCLRTSTVMEAKLMLKTGDEAETLKDFCAAV